MEEVRKYVVDGYELKVTAYYDELSGKYLENYDPWLGGDVYTPSGHPIRVSVIDACEFAEGIGSYPCVECAVCRFYSRAAPKTLIGVCMNPKKSNKRGNNI